jgi:hypothetical protein
MAESSQEHATYIAFAGDRNAAWGSLRDVARAMKALVEREPDAQVLVFDETSGAQVDLNLHGSLEEVLRRLPETRAEAIAAASGPGLAATRSVGRPKLGVVAREVTLLPRHWTWLSSQPGGASVALRKLVEQAQRDNKENDELRLARESSYRFINAMAGDQPGFEEAVRALFAGSREQFDVHTAGWPADVREHARKMADAGLNA